MSLDLPTLYTLNEIHEAINQGRAVVTRRTLEEICRELGFAKGRGRVMLFRYEDALEIQNAVKCRRAAPARGEPTKKAPNLRPGKLSRNIARELRGSPF